MKFKRAFLAAELSILEPAIANNAKIPGLDSLWFSGTEVSAYNDMIGIKKPLETDFVGGVPGKVLLGYLGKIGTEEIDLTAKPTGKEDPITGEEYQDLVLTAGKSRLKLALKPPSQRLWELPNYNKDDTIPIPKDLLTMLEFCLVSVGKGTVDPEFLGVTFDPQGKHLTLYSTDAASMSRGYIPKSGIHNRVTIPTEFCEQLLKLFPAESSLYLSDNCTIATNPKTGTTLFGRILEIESPRDFNAIVENNMVGNFLDIPPEFESAIKRASLVQENHEPIRLTLTKDKLELYIHTVRGELREEMPMELEAQDKVVAYFDPAMIERALDERGLFAMTKDAFMMEGPENYLYILSTIHTKEDE